MLTVTDFNLQAQKGTIKYKNMETDYYIKRKDDLTNFISSLEHYLGNELKKYSAEGIDFSVILRAAKEKFIRLLPELPFIGEKNPNLKSLIGAAYEMGLYEILEKEGFSLKEISYINQKALYKLTKEKTNVSSLLAIKNSITTKEYYKKEALISQKKKYAGDWVYESVEPHKKDNFDMGINYTECGLVKLFETYGKERYLPYICLNDYAIFGAMDIQLKRTQTLANGGCMCDFRFKTEGGKIKKGWPPEYFPEFKLK
jgi:hypothetical protein